MKNFFRILLLPALFFTLILSGCKKDEPMLWFYSQPLSEQSVYAPERNFAACRTIYYLLYVPKGFKYDYIRTQIVKKSDKTNHWGYKIYQSKDYHIDASKNYFTNSFVINEAGYYFMQIFYMNDADRVIARNDFWVKSP